MSIMEESKFPIATVVAIIASLIGLISVLFFCAWCFGSRRDDDEDYQPINAEQGHINGDQQPRKKKFSWKDRWEFNKSPAIMRSTIKFEKPDKKMTIEGVQPDQNSQTTLNETLGWKAAMQRQESLASGGSNNGVYQGHSKTAIEIEEEDHKLGRLQFSVGYDFNENTLIVKVMRATSLPAKDFTGTSDPYVKVIILPDKLHKLQTKIRKKCLNPYWNETFLFEGFPYHKVESKLLMLQVVDFDRFSRDDVIGEVVVPLSSINLAASPIYWRFIQPSSKTRGKLGELLVSLSYHPSAGKITMVVIKARDLKAKDVSGSSDPYVKMWMLHQGKRVEKRKTTVKMCTLNPVFNESFEFDVPVEKIRETSLLVSVMDFDKIGRNELIGKFLLANRSGPLESKHWSEMMQNPRQTISQWHLLKD